MPRTALCVLALVPLVSGCVAVAAASVLGVGVVQYQRNEAEQDFATNLQETWNATLEGLQRLEVVPEEFVLGPTEGHIRHGDLLVLVERHAEGFTRVRVRIGTFHSRDHVRRARLVLQEVGTSIEGQDELRAWADKIKARPQPLEPKLTAPKPTAPKPRAPKP
ncbi:MAG: DUF3568 family protein [Planctomycetes bacterium]|nr:DUF3568 family protein [Planctomycetota bacterium]